MFSASHGIPERFLRGAVHLAVVFLARFLLASPEAVMRESEGSGGKAEARKHLEAAQRALRARNLPEAKTQLAFALKADPKLAVQSVLKGVIV